MPLVVPHLLADWPNALVDFVRGVRRYAYATITVALCCALAGYLITKIHPPRTDAYAVVQVEGSGGAVDLENLLLQDEFLAAVARQTRVGGDEDASHLAAALHGAAEISARELENQVEVHVLAADADLAADIANAVAQAWLQLSSSGKQVLVTAQTPDGRFGGQAGVAALVALAGALLLGLLFSGLKEVLHARFRLPGDITARMPVLELGTIPDCRPGKDARQRQTLIDTAFRSLLQSLWSTGRPGRRPRVVVVASPQPGDGRSMVAANLALAFADTSRWVLLIDGNARTPSLHGVFSVHNNWGLADVLREDTAIDLYDFQRLFQRSAVAGLWVLPAGTAPLDLSSRQAQERLSDLVARARMEFHNVIVDTPPGPLPEVPILANSADGVLIVVRASKTTQRSAIALADQFFGRGIGVVGAVLNDWRPGVA
jgi:succinoglycan biosynthesis transport protein ExoP